MIKILCADALEELRTLPNASVFMCVTSPPYYGWRDYGNAGQIGIEDSPEQYIQKLTAVFREVRRVLRPDGTLWLNIADSYAGSGKGIGRKPTHCKHSYQTKRYDWNSMDVGVCPSCRWLVSPFGHYLEQDQLSAGKCKRSSHKVL